jgi:hypothetical protein
MTDPKQSLALIRRHIPALHSPQSKPSPQQHNSTGYTYATGKIEGLAELLEGHMKEVIATMADKIGMRKHSARGSNLDTVG